MGFFNFFKSHSKTYKSVFSITVDTNAKYQEYSNNKIERNYPITLTPDGKYWFGKQEQYATYNDIKVFVMDVLNNELDNEFKQFFDIPVIDIKVKGVYEGSIEVFLVVVFGTIASIAGIKDLYDSINFLGTLVEKKLEQRLKKRYGDYFRVDVRKQIPRNTDYIDEKYFYKHHDNIVKYLINNNHIKRDSFFYYLLISNILLTGIIIILVAKAVLEVYF